MTEPWSRRHDPRRRPRPADQGSLIVPLGLPGVQQSAPVPDFSPAVTRRMRSGESTRGTTGWTQSRPGRMTPTGPGLRSSRAEGWRRSWTCRSFRLRRTSSPWLSLRATRSKRYASGPPVGACRLIGRGVYSRQEVGGGGAGGWCGSRGLIEPVLRYCPDHLNIVSSRSDC